MTFKDRNCVISGGTSGIGLVVAQQMVLAGANVIILGRDQNKGRKAIEILGSEAIFIVCDVSDSQSVDAAFDEIERRFEHLEFAVNNAGVTAPYAPISEISVSDWDRVMRINASGPLYCLRRELKCIRRAQGGAIVNVSSCAGVVAIAHQAAYTASKAAVNALTQVAAMENATDDEQGFAVRVNAVAPGPTLGGMNSLERLAANPVGTQRKKDATAMKRFANPEEIANSIMYLLSSKSSYITGTILSVDGGYHIGKF